MPCIFHWEWILNLYPIVDHDFWAYANINRESLTFIPINFDLYRCKSLTCSFLLTENFQSTSILPINLWLFLLKKLNLCRSKLFISTSLFAVNHWAVLILTINNSFSSIWIFDFHCCNSLTCIVVNFWLTPTWVFDFYLSIGHKSLIFDNVGHESATCTSINLYLATLWIFNLHQCWPWIINFHFRNSLIYISVNFEPA